MPRANMKILIASLDVLLHSFSVGQTNMLTIMLLLSLETFRLKKFAEKKCRIKNKNIIYIYLHPHLLLNELKLYIYLLSREPLQRFSQNFELYMLWA